MKKFDEIINDALEQTSINEKLEKMTAEQAVEKTRNMINRLAQALKATGKNKEAVKLLKELNKAMLKKDFLDDRKGSVQFDATGKI